ncbi:MAG: hypothetical protein JXR95_03600 [Deltaproteobacteria bacterium]|nr:hypothetical protein [Deltaproteobacteria bacterium]
MKFNEIPVTLKNKVKSDFLASGAVTLISGLIFMGIIQVLVIVFPA